MYTTCDILNEMVIKYVLNPTNSFSIWWSTHYLLSLVDAQGLVAGVILNYLFFMLHNHLTFSFIFLFLLYLSQCRCFSDDPCQLMLLYMELFHSSIWSLCLRSLKNLERATSLFLRMQSSQQNEEVIIRNHQPPVSILRPQTLAKSSESGIRQALYGHQPSIKPSCTLQHGLTWCLHLLRLSSRHHIIHLGSWKEAVAFNDCSCNCRQVQNCWGPSIC